MDSWARKTRGIHRYGTRAAQPAANDVYEGTLYYVSDEDVVERSNGTNWVSWRAGKVWQSVAFNAANFTAIGGSGTQAWTVDSADVLAYNYKIMDGDTMLVTVDFVGTTVTSTGVGPTVLQVVLPESVTAVKRSTSVMNYSNNGVVGSGVMNVQDLGTTLRFQLESGASWSIPSTNNTRVRGSIVFEI